ncbi:hypothetical protein D3C81_2287910 [compost metagenome]
MIFVSLSQLLLIKNTDNRMTVAITPMFGSEVRTFTIAVSVSFIRRDIAAEMVLAVLSIFLLIV